MLTCFINDRWTAAGVSAVLLLSAAFITLKFSGFSIFTSSILRKPKQTVRWMFLLLHRTHIPHSIQGHPTQTDTVLLCSILHRHVTQYISNLNRYRKFNYFSLQHLPEKSPISTQVPQTFVIHILCVTTYCKHVHTVQYITFDTGHYTSSDNNWTLTQN